MQERFNWRSWKDRVPQGTVGSNPTLSAIITLEDFKKLDIKIGKVISAEKIPDSLKLIKLIFDIVADVDGRPVFLHPEEEIPPGNIVR